MLGLALVVVQATTPAGASPRAGRVPLASPFHEIPAAEVRKDAKVAFP